MIIWEDVIDNRFKCLVERVGDSLGYLSVVDSKDNNTLLGKDVPLHYGAIFGPDIDDVTNWKALAIRVVDEFLKWEGDNDNGPIEK